MPVGCGHMVVGKVPLNVKVSMMPMPMPIDVSRCVGVMDKTGDADWLGGGVARVAMWCSRDVTLGCAAWWKMREDEGSFSEGCGIIYGGVWTIWNYYY